MSEQPPENDAAVEVDVETDDLDQLLDDSDPGEPAAAAEHVDVPVQDPDATETEDADEDPSTAVADDQ